MVKILTPIPNTWPSFLYSIAGAATELANPVIGTNTPAPANFAIGEKRWSAVNKIEIPIKQIDTQVPTSSFLISD